MRQLNCLLFGLLLLAACAQPADTAAPPPAPATPTHPTALMTPQSSFFYGLPSFRAGETAAYEGYQITLTDVVLDGGELSLTLDLRNETDRAVDLGWAVQLHHRETGYVPPAEQPAGDPPSLGPGGVASGVWRYDLGETITSPDALGDYLLLYAPRGWSGPVVVYRLDIALPAGLSRAAVSQTPTGDPWKMLVLVYRGIDVDYTDLDGSRKHLTATMPQQDAELMVKSFRNLPHRGVVYDYSDQTAELEAHVVYVTRPLTSLTPIGDGYWPSPDDTRPELNAYAPLGVYDSVIVFWQASHPTTDQSIPAFGWGLGGWAYDYTYASVFNLSWVWPSGACQGEVFLHEWLHGVTAFYQYLNFPFPVEDLHGAEEAGYTTDEDGCWRTWLRDYMRGLVYENGVRTGLTPEAWRSGSITTHDIQNWRGEYFDNETLAGPPVVVRDDPAVWFAWGLAAPHPLLAADHFSARWTRRLSFAGGAYTFYLAHNDGARLYLDGQLLLDKWGRGGSDSVTVPIAAGPHVLRVEHHEVAGVAEARLYWRTAGSARTFYLPAAFVSE